MITIFNLAQKGKMASFFEPYKVWKWFSDILKLSDERGDEGESRD